MQGTLIRVITGDTRILDYSSYVPRTIYLKVEEVTYELQSKLLKGII